MTDRRKEGNCVKGGSKKKVFFRSTSTRTNERQLEETFSSLKQSGLRREMNQFFRTLVHP